MTNRRQLPWIPGRKHIGARLVIEPAVAAAMRRASGVHAGSRASGMIRLAASRALHSERRNTLPALDGSLPIRIVVETASPTVAAAAAPKVAAAGATGPFNTMTDASRSLPIRSVATPASPASAAAPAPHVTAPPAQDIAADFAAITNDAHALKNYQAGTYGGPIYTSDIFTKEVYVVDKDSMANRTLRDIKGDIIEHSMYGYSWIRDDGRNNLRKELEMVERQMRIWDWAQKVKPEQLSKAQEDRRAWALKLDKMRKGRRVRLETVKKGLERLIRMPMGAWVTNMRAVEEWRVCQLGMRGLNTGWRVRAQRMTMEKSQANVRREEIEAKGRTKRVERVRGSGLGGAALETVTVMKKRLMEGEARVGVGKKAKVAGAEAEAANASRDQTTSEDKSDEMMDSEKTLG